MGKIEQKVQLYLMGEFPRLMELAKERLQSS